LTGDINPAPVSDLTDSETKLVSEENRPIDAIRATIRSFAFGSNRILEEIELRVRPGEAVSILGPSGCGKTTLVGVLAGLLPRRRQEILQGRIELFGSSPPSYRRAGKLAVMFQDPTLLPHLPVRENVELPLKILRRGQEKDVSGLLDLVGLRGFSDYLPRDLSGGMRTRVALARSFVSGPETLFLDEPFTGLDLGWKESLYGSLQDLRIRYGTTVLIVTHDLQEAVYNSDRVLVMDAGGQVSEEVKIDGGFPRPYRFGATISHHTDTLEHLASLVTHHREAELS